ncbi:acyl-CoA dehydrogenase family protein [Croceicoccus sp. F390]|uniref:Acyl-CoA dehydrogenase family protein n=1 Tax=Croceicoccus esteveae TaxID=3075597 RepID=A0ABU2ZIE5_9SPHN|nr:acyl-CoA dehydrogenase family protein [Croceicoccus sp. F390]MDT0575177.1 acyl-CoA dehydrogenase family protein [Croceicoccus sp. F390]
MKLGFSAAEEDFRTEVADWLATQMHGDFADIRGVRGLTEKAGRRKEWEQRLGEERWSVIGWPEQWGGRDASLVQQVIFAEEYARSGAPGRIGHMGVELAGPTILTFGTQEQKERFLPDIAKGNTIWCQGYSEPGAGSDLGNVRTRARQDEETGEWVVDGQKIWTSLAQISDWIFVVARSEEGSKGPKGLTFLLMPIDQPGIDIRPIRQINGDAEFNETFFDGARTGAENLVSTPGNGWQVAMGLLAFERGVSTLGQQMGFRIELDEVIAAARENGAAKDPLIRQRIADAEIGLYLMRYGALRMLSNTDHSRPDGAALTYKMQWASWRRNLGELAMDVAGLDGLTTSEDDYSFDPLPNLFLFSRADTIYGGTNQVQRNIISERALGLPREPRGAG